MSQKITRSGGMLAISMVQEAMNVIWPTTLCRFDFVELNPSDSYPNPDNAEFELFREIIVSGKQECGGFFTARCKMGLREEKWQPIHINLSPGSLWGDNEFDFVLHDAPNASEATFIIDPTSRKETWRSRRDRRKDL